MLLLVSSQNTHVHLVMSLVSPIVLGARKSLSEKRKYGKDHVGGLSLTDLAELLEVNFLFVSEGEVEDLCHLL